MEEFNFFFEGLHRDNDPSAQPPNTYRDGLNGNIISYGQNQFAFESVKGNIISFSLPSHATNQPKFTPIGGHSFMDRLILFSANDAGGLSATEPFPGEIGTVSFTPDGIGIYTALYYHRGLRFTKEHSISRLGGTVGKPENASIVRVYWTDDFNPLRAINVADPIFTTYILTGSLVVGKQYMVLPGGTSNNIIHNAVTYGPGETAGNVFTAGNVNYTNLARVIEYVSVESLDVVPGFNMSTILFKHYNTNGNLFSGSYEYSYQLESSDGARTNWSYVTLPIFVNGPTIPGNNTISYQNLQGAATAINSGKSITINISGIDTNFKKIRVAMIRSTSLGVYKDPEVFYYDDILSSSMDIIHYGNETTEKIKITTITTATSVVDLVGSISSTKNIFFAANVGLQGDIEYDPSTWGSLVCVSIPYLIPTDLTGNVTSANTIGSGYGMHGHAQYQDIATGNGSILPDIWYQVYGTGTITYNAVVYAVGDHFVGIVGVTGFAVSSGSPKVVAVHRIQKYTGSYRYFPIEKDYADYKGMVASHYMKSHWREEKYRYAMVLWSTKSQPLSAHFLMDKTFPSQYATTDPDTGGALGYNPRLCEYYAGSLQASLRILGAKFSGIDFGSIAASLGVAVADLSSFVKGFSIVRVPRDAQILAQGILFPTMGDGTDTRPVSISDIGSDFYYTGAGTFLGRRPNYYNWYSPDFQLGFNGLPNLATGDRIKLVDYYDPVTGDTEGILAVDNHNYYYKYQVQTGPKTAGTPMYNKGSMFDIIPEQSAFVEWADAAVYVGGLPGPFNNKARTSAGAPMGERWGKGARTMVIDINVDETPYPFGFGCHETGTLCKPLANIIRPKANLYGGTTAAAKANNQYIYAGHFQPFDAAFLSYLAGNAGVADNVEVFGGDCYVCMYDNGRICKDTPDANPQVSFGAIFPIESNVNTNLREGRTFGKDRFNGTDALNGIEYPNHPEEYIYRDVFSNDESQVFYQPKPLGFKPQIRNDKLIIYSLQKTDGEIIDNFKQFLPNNYRYADGQYGSITNIDGNGDRLFYWQQKGFGYMPVGERVSIGSPLGNAIQLGVGGTLERQDEIDTYYGLQHPHSLIKCEEAYAWFDLRRKSMMRFDMGGGVRPYSTIKGLEAFFSTFLNDIEMEAFPNIFDSDSPMTGKGIVSVYDSRFKMGLMTFKYDTGNVRDVVERNFTIGFSKKLDKYIGFFSFAPGFWIEHNGHLLSAKIVRATIQDSTAYIVGDEVVQGGVNYVNILAYTSGSPAIAASADPTHWAVASNINNVYVNWRGDICKFYGKVYEWYITAIIRSPGRDKICVDNVEIEGNEVPFNNVYISNKYQTGQDLNISTTNRNYSYIDGSWRFNFPFTSKGARLTDSYIQVKLSVKNYTGIAITVANNLVKRVFSIKSFLRKKL